MAYETKSFQTEAEAAEYAARQKATGYLTTVYPPQKPGARNLAGRWIVERR